MASPGGHYARPLRTPDRVLHVAGTDRPSRYETARRFILRRIVARKAAGADLDAALDARTEGRAGSATA